MIACPRCTREVLAAEIVAVVDSPGGLVVAVADWTGPGRVGCACGWSCAVVAPAHLPWPAERPRGRVRCGTDSGWRSHFLRDEKPCSACREAHRVAWHHRRAGRPVPLAPRAEPVPA